MKPALYNAYLTGAMGSSIVLFYMGNGRIVGIDVGGAKYEGTYITNNNQTYTANIHSIMPPSEQLITGATSPADAKPIPLTITLKEDFFLNKSISTIETPFGPINAIFEKRVEI